MCPYFSIVQNSTFSIEMIRADLVIRNIRELVTCAGPAPLAGPRQREVWPLYDATIASFRGRIVFVGSAQEAASALDAAPDARIVDASGMSVVPGFVDPHTHLVFAGDRRDELRRRLAGATYAEIAAAGGGILSTVTATRAASEDELVRQSLDRAGRDAGMRHHHLRGEERLRSRSRKRVEDAARGCPSR